MRKTSLVLAVLLAVAGMCVMLWPVFTGQRLQADTDEAVQSFLEERKPEQQYPELLAALQEYNRQLYAEKQCNLTDLKACEPSIWPPMALTMKSSVCWRYLLWS